MPSSGARSSGRPPALAADILATVISNSAPIPEPSTGIDAATGVDAAIGVTERLRVAVYVLPHDRDDHLLVFDHVDVPEAGVQIPAGGVEPGESLDAAARREVAEECGVGELDQLRAIGVQRSRGALTVFFAARAVLDDLPRLHTVGSADADDTMRFGCRLAPIDDPDLIDGQADFLRLAGLSRR